MTHAAGSTTPTTKAPSNGDKTGGQTAGHPKTSFRVHRTFSGGVRPNWALELVPPPRLRPTTSALLRRRLTRFACVSLWFGLRPVGSLGKICYHALIRPSLTKLNPWGGVPSKSPVIDPIPDRRGDGAKRRPPRYGMARHMSECRSGAPSEIGGGSRRQNTSDKEVCRCRSCVGFRRCGSP